MGIFHYSRQNQVTLSDDWKTFSGLFHNIGAFLYKDAIQTAFFDDNAQRILGVPREVARDSYRSLTDRLTAEPVDGEQDLFVVRSGAEKRYLKIHIIRRKDSELGFVEEMSRRVAQQNADQQDFDSVTNMLTLPAFSNLVQRRLPTVDKFYFAALQVAGLDKMVGFTSAASSNYCMASVAEVLNRFASEKVLFTSKSFQNFYVCFIDMDEQNVRMLLEQMRSAVASCTISDDLGQTISADNHSVLDLRIGLAVYPEEGDTLSKLMPCAEFALFETRHDSKNPITRFSQAVYEQKKDEYRNEQMFSRIVGENLLTYHFQPIVDARTGAVMGYEALMRPTGEYQFTPSQMLALAEKYDRLYDIEYATMFNCMRYLSEHQNAFSGKKLFINCIPSSLLSDSDFNELMLTYEELFGKVVLEIIEQSDASEEMLALLKNRSNRLNATLAIDDYGSGYANTTTLLRNMPQYVKIDHSLILDICKDTKKQQLVSGIIDYAHDNQIQVLAEGVEEDADLKTVIRLGVDFVQGYYTARPTPYLLEEISDEVRDVIINTNLECAKSSGQKKIYNVHDDEVLDLVGLALQNYTDIHIFRHALTIIGDPDKTVPMHITIAENHSCELKLRNVNLVSNDKPTISIGSYAQLTMILEGNNSLNYMGIRVPQGAFLNVQGSGNLKIDCYAKFGYGIGGDCDSSYGCITLDSTGTVDIIVNSDRGVGIGGGYNPDDAEICLESGDIHVNVASPNGVGIGCTDGLSLIYANPGCNLEIDISGISMVGMGSLSGETHIDCKTDVLFTGGGNRVVGLGVLNQGTGEVFVSDSKLRFSIRSNFGTCIGAVGGKVDVTTQNCKVEVNAEGGEITGIGDAKGSGDVTLDHTELKAFILAAKPHEAGTRNGKFSMHGSTIIADINEKHNTQQ